MDVVKGEFPVLMVVGEAQNEKLGNRGHKGCVLAGLGHTALWDMLVHKGSIWCGPQIWEMNAPSYLK